MFSVPSSGDLGNPSTIIGSGCKFDSFSASDGAQHTSTRSSKFIPYRLQMRLVNMSREAFCLSLMPPTGGCFSWTSSRKRCDLENAEPLRFLSVLSLALLQPNLRFFRSRLGKPNQRKGQNEKFMNFDHFCEFWCFSLGKQARFTLNFCSGMPLRKVHELTFLWFGLPGPLLNFAILRFENAALFLCLRFFGRLSPRSPLHLGSCLRPPNV